MKIIRFIIEVEDREEKMTSDQQAEMLASMEDVANRTDFAIYDQRIEEDEA